MGNLFELELKYQMVFLVIILCRYWDLNHRVLVNEASVLATAVLATVNQM